MRKKKKRLFIESLEQRRSTSPLLVQTMSAGESGAIGIDSKGSSGTSAAQLANKQSAKENLITLKNDTLIDINSVDLGVRKYGPGPIPTTLALGEEGKPVKPEPIDIVIEKYGPGPMPIDPVIGKYGPGPIPIEPVIMKYGPGPIPIEPVVVKYGPGPIPVDPVVVKYGPGPTPIEPVIVKYGPGPIPVDPVIVKYGPGPTPENTVCVTTQVTKAGDSSKGEAANEFILRKIAKLRNKIREALHGPTERMGRNVDVSVSKAPTLKKVTLIVGEDVNNPK